LYRNKIEDSLLTKKRLLAGLCFYSFQFLNYVHAASPRGTPTYEGIHGYLYLLNLEVSIFKKRVHQEKKITQEKRAKRKKRYRKTDYKLIYILNVKLKLDLMLKLKATRRFCELKS
jgi:hypothetical protein